MRASLIHVPKGLSAEDWGHNYINIMPMGAYSVANYANARGHSVNVLNSSIFKNRPAALERIFAAIESNESQVVGIPLHWHFSGADVLFVAERIKERRPEVKVVLGGITATVFGRELMETCSAIDAVVHGDGEVPFARYLEELDRGAQADLGTVPNLRWRSGDDLRWNGVTFVATAEQYSSFDYGISKVVDDLRQYPNGWTMIDAVDGRIRDLQAEVVGQKVFFVNLGRGCSYDCVYCSGCKMDFATHFGRDEPIARSVDAVLATIRDAYALGFRRFHFCWDCAFKGKEQHLRELFRRTPREVGDDVSIIYEAYNLPSAGFVELATRSFRHVTLILSPNFFEEATMRRFMGYSYTLDDLRGCIDGLAKHPSCTPFVFFGITPLEDWSERGYSSKLAVMLELKRRGCKVSAMPIYAEPGSPWVTFPELFGTEVFRLSFRDFLEEWRKPLTPWNDRLAGIENVGALMQRLEQDMSVDKLLSGLS